MWISWTLVLVLWLEFLDEGKRFTAHRQQPILFLKVCVLKFSIFDSFPITNSTLRALKRIRRFCFLWRDTSVAKAQCSPGLHGDIQMNFTERGILVRGFAFYGHKWINKIMLERIRNFRFLFLSSDG